MLIKIIIAECDCSISLIILSCWKLLQNYLAGVKMLPVLSSTIFLGTVYGMEFIEMYFGLL